MKNSKTFSLFQFCWLETEICGKTTFQTSYGVWYPIPVTTAVLLELDFWNAVFGLRHSQITPSNVGYLIWRISFVSYWKRSSIPVIDRLKLNVITLYWIDKELFMCWNILYLFTIRWSTFFEFFRVRIFIYVRIIIVFRMKKITAVRFQKLI